MGEKLASPPLVEALCEFRFVPSGDWDWTIPGMMFERIGTEFPERTQVQVGGIRLPRQPDQRTPFELFMGPERVQFKRKDNSAMVQVGPNLLVVNQFQPYPSWEAFRRLIVRMFETYGGLSGQSALSRIGLRYINQIFVPVETTRIGDLITLAPPLVGSLDRPLAGFYQRYELVHEVPKGVLVHQSGKQKDAGREILFIDLDLASSECGNLSTPEATEDWLNRAHDRVYEAFVSSITPQLYEQFRRGES